MNCIQVDDEVVRVEVEVSYDWRSGCKIIYSGSGLQHMSPWSVLSDDRRNVSVVKSLELLLMYVSTLFAITTTW